MCIRDSYKALQVDVEREHRYCQKVEEDFLQELNRKKPKMCRRDRAGTV